MKFLVPCPVGKGVSPNYFFQNNINLTFRGGGGRGLGFVCQQNVGTDDTVWHRTSRETTQYEQFIEQYDGKHKGSAILF